MSKFLHADDNDHAKAMAIITVTLTFLQAKNAGNQHFLIFPKCLLPY